MKLFFANIIIFIIISATSLAQDKNNKTTAQSNRKVIKSITELDESRYLLTSKIDTDGTEHGTGSVYVGDYLKDFTGLENASEKDTIRKIEIPARYISDDIYIQAVTYFFFPKGIIKINFSNTGWPSLTRTPTSLDTIFRSSIFIDTDTTGYPIAFAATATTAFILLKWDGYQHFFPVLPPVRSPFKNPKFYSDKYYVYLTDITLGENKYRFSKTEKGCDYMHLVK